MRGALLCRPERLLWLRRPGVSPNALNEGDEFSRSELGGRPSCVGLNSCEFSYGGSGPNEDLPSVEEAGDGDQQGHRRHVHDER
jgi:hypothetical protein